MKNLAIVLLLLVSSLSHADEWTPGGWKSGGVTVEAVYLNFIDAQVTFVAGDGNYYHFPWGANNSEMTANAKAVHSQLLTAFATKKKVSVYYTPSNTANINYSVINLHH